MNVWLIFLLGGLLTFLMRFSFIYAFGRIQVPPALHRALRFVPPAVLSAIIFPEVLMSNGHIDAGLGNHRLLAGTLAVAAALWTRRTSLTIAVGMAAMLILQAAL